jgi:pSer/pThr/pTyr-binding forkhead associated (FHA) protein
VSAYVELLVKGARDRIPLSGEKVAIGQSPSNDIPLPFDPTVSRLHAVLESLPSGWCIRDLNSLNGTFLNGDRIWGERPLRPGDEVRLGRTTLIFRVNEPVEPGGSTVGAEKAPELTRREREVLLSLCAPLMSGEPFREPASIRQIAQDLFVTEAAVKPHLRRLNVKFGIGEQEEHRRVRLANEALRQGAVSMAEIQDWVKRKESRQG